LDRAVGLNATLVEVAVNLLQPVIRVDELRQRRQFR
jgi:hypothetical protein